MCLVMDIAILMLTSERGCISMEKVDSLIANHDQVLKRWREHSL